MQIEVQDRQNLVDVAIQHYGDADAIRLLVLDNPGLGFSSTLLPGQVLNVKQPPSTQTAQAVKAYFAAKKIVIATDRYEVATPQTGNYAPYAYHPESYT